MLSFYQGDLYCDDYFHRFITQPYCEGILNILNTVAMKLDTLISINDS